LPCTWISKWLTLKIDDDPKVIFVSDEPKANIQESNNGLKEHPIIKDVMIFEESPDVINPKGCNDSRLSDPEFMRHCGRAQTILMGFINDIFRFTSSLYTLIM